MAKGFDAQGRFDCPTSSDATPPDTIATAQPMATRGNSVTSQLLFSQQGDKVPVTGESEGSNPMRSMAFTRMKEANAPAPVPTLRSAEKTFPG